MSRHAMVVAVILAATGGAGCAPPPAATDAQKELREVLVRAKRAQRCADDLLRAADLDPDATARLIEIEPAALAPWGDAERGRKVIREVIIARAESARTDARVARSLALLGDGASSELDALRREKTAHSLAVSSALCVAAGVVQNGTIAQSR